MRPRGLQQEFLMLFLRAAYFTGAISGFNATKAFKTFLSRFF